MPSARRCASLFRPTAIESLESRRLCATIVVTNTDSLYEGSLYSAIIDAAPGDTIDLRGVSGTIEAYGYFGIDKDLTIIGPGSDALTITTAGQNTRAFLINEGLNVNLSGFRIDASGSSTLAGGGIRVDGYLDTPGTLVMNDIVVTNCVADETGGGLSAEYTNVTMTNCRFAGNTAVNELNALGGGVYVNSGSLRAFNSTFDSNVARATNLDGWYVFEASALGGGVALMNGSASSFTNCTFAGNTATADRGNDDGSSALALGGGLAVAMYGNLDVVNCTFAANAANGSGAESLGGGFNVFSFGTGNAAGTDVLKVANNVFANNTAAAGPDAFGLDVGGYGVANLKNNVIGVADYSGIENGVKGNRAGSADSPLNAKLGTLTNNGGLVPTIALDADSPAMGAASGADAPRTDARNRPRSNTIDAGAYERQTNYSPALLAWPDDVALAETPYVSNIAAIDYEGDPITFTLVNGPAWLSLDDRGNGTATLVGTPTVNDAGDATVLIRASDGSLSWDESFTLSTTYEQVSLSSAGVLRVAGSDDADVIHVWQPAGSGGAVRVAVGKRVRNFAADAVTAIQIYGRGGDDVLIGNAIDLGCYIQAGDGDDTLIGGDRPDSLTAAAGDDSVLGMGGDDWIDGNSGRDNLAGNDGNDRVYGGNGRDYIDGGGGSDVLYGEVGPDLFVSYDRARDWIFGGEPDINYVQGDAGGKDILYDATLLTT